MSVYGLNSADRRQNLVRNEIDKRLFFFVWQTNQKYRSQISGVDLQRRFLPRVSWRLHIHYIVVRCCVVLEWWCLLFRWISSTWNSSNCWYVLPAVDIKISSTHVGRMEKYKNVWN